MKDVLTIMITDDVQLEIGYTHWAEMKSNDYDVPNDPSGHEIDSIKFVSWVGTGKGNKVRVEVDITGCSEELARELNWDKIEQSVTEHIEEK